MTSNRDLSEIMELMDAGFCVGFDQFGILSIPGIPDDEEKTENLLISTLWQAALRLLWISF